MCADGMVGDKCATVRLSTSFISASILNRLFAALQKPYVVSVFKFHCNFFFSIYCNCYCLFGFTNWPSSLISCKLLEAESPVYPNFAGYRVLQKIFEK